MTSDYFFLHMQKPWKPSDQWAQGYSLLHPGDVGGATIFGSEWTRGDWAKRPTKPPEFSFGNLCWVVCFGKIWPHFFQVILFEFWTFLKQYRCGASLGQPVAEFGDVSLSQRCVWTDQNIKSLAKSLTKSLVTKVGAKPAQLRCCIGFRQCDWGRSAASVYQNPHMFGCLAGSFFCCLGFGTCFSGLLMGVW